MVETTTDANGNYTSPSLATLTAPYLVHVIKAGPPAIELYSIGSAAGVVNVHPLTDLIIRTWYEVQGTDVVTEFNAAVPATPPTATELNVIKQVVKNLVVQFLELIGNVSATSFDLISTPFTANSAGFDRFLDNVNVVGGEIAINAASGVQADYVAALVVEVDGTLTSTLNEDVNNDGTFSVVSETNHDIAVGITTSPYAGVWSLNFTQTVVGDPNLCGGAVNDTGTLPFVVDGSGNFILLETDGSGRVMISGNISSTGVLNATVYGDSLLSTGTCPAGTLTATFTTTSAGTGTFAQGGDAGNLVFTRLAATPSPFAGIWKLTHTTTQVLDTANCSEALASINTPIVDGDGLITIDAAGDFVSVASAISGHVSNTGAVTFSDTNAGSCTFVSGAGTLTIGSIIGSGTFGTPGAGDLSGTWTMVRQ